MDLPAHFPRFIDSPGLGTGFGSFAFHPEFVSAGAPGCGKFYTGHVETPVGTLSPLNFTMREIFAYGFRNPHRISWDTEGSGKMICGTIYRLQSVDHDFVEDLGLGMVTGGVALTFPTEDGKAYRVWSSAGLQFWEFIDSAITGDGDPALWMDSSPDERRFYKMEAIPSGP